MGLVGKHTDGLYLAIMCALSSTAIVVKLLYDKGEFDTLPGRLTLGVLVIQDVYAILLVAAAAVGSNAPHAWSIPATVFAVSSMTSACSRARPVPWPPARGCSRRPPPIGRPQL
jgi:Kef-type K+ transport system membrane component KefB